MAFGNPYGDPWNDEELRTAIARIVKLGIQSLSLADTVGIADAKLIQQVVEAAMKSDIAGEIGVHLHSTPADAISKILAAYDAGVRRFDSAFGGLGGCPFAQNRLVGNIPTESVISALQQRDVHLPFKIDTVVQLNERIGSEFA
jgi:hydroxymethylglutaryl-CoA lyase